MTTPLHLRLVFAAFAAAVFLASCGSSTSVEADAANQPRADVISEQDIDVARASFQSALAEWETIGVADYTLQLSLQSIGQLSVEVIDGAPGAEEFEGPDDVDDWFGEPLPRTVEVLFDWVEQEIVQFEADPSLVPGFDECGSHLNVRFDGQLGYPTYFDTLGPCDDGVGLSVIVTNFDPLAEELEAAE